MRLSAALEIEQDFDGDVSDYRRITDYTNGELKVQWKANNVSYERTSFVSRPDNVIPAEPDEDNSIYMVIDWTV